MDPIFAPAHADALVGQVLPGGLRVLEPLGGTAIGPLYRAQYAAGPSVALVLLDPPPTPRASSAGAAAAAKLVEQLRRACQIYHPNVAGLMEVGEAPDGRTYAVAEFLTGQSLSDLLAARGALPPQEAAELCLQAAGGLNAAHQVGIVHGELSPRTILVALPDGGRPLVKLACFNLDADTEEGRRRSAMTDPRYSSPERLAGGAPDRAGDVFSLGGVLHHLLTGEPPGNRLARKSLPQPLARVVDRALAPSPDRRYRTVASFAEELAEAVRVFRRPARFRWRRMLAGAIGAGILAVGAWFGWSRYQSSGAGARAEQEVGMQIPERADSSPTRADPAPAGAATRDTAPNARRAPVPARPAAAQPGKPIPPPGSKRTAVAAKPSPRKAAPRDSGAATALSPFRRAHPWAADPEGRVYFPSSCPLALQSRELLYFTSESEAQATGRSRSTAPGCS
ncbi:MAG: protein kinase [Gemmatimonadales bacterium]